MSIGQRFAKFLDVRNFSPTDIERITGYSRVSATNIRDGRTLLPKVDFIEAIMRHFPDLNIRWLVLGEGEMFVKSEKDLDDDRFLRIMDQLARMEQKIEEMEKKE